VVGPHLMCNYCNYTSPKRYLLTRHMKAHSEERPHKCTICSRMFKTIPALQNHVNTHTGVRPQHCKVVPSLIDSLLSVIVLLIFCCQCFCTVDLEPRVASSLCEVLLIRGHFIETKETSV